MFADSPGQRSKRFSGKSEKVMTENSKKKILIVEDSEIIAKYLADILGKYGTVDIANNGQEALVKVSLLI
jgi:PleD family two-component response regulator